MSTTKKPTTVTSFIFGFKKLIRFLVSIFASREMGFIYCLMGTVTQIAHTYFLTYNISSLDGNWKTIQAVLLSSFISSSLLYFVVISDNSATKESRRIHIAINIFMVIEILINMYYYTRHLILDSAEMQIFDFIFAVLISCLIPVTLKLYAGLIQAKSWFDEFAETRNQESVNSSVEIKSGMTEEEIRQLIDEKVSEMSGELSNQNIDDKIKELIKATINSEEVSTEKVKLLVHDAFAGEMEKQQNNIDQQVSESFKKNSSMFLTQFENKLKLLMNNYGGKKQS